MPSQNRDIPVLAAEFTAAHPELDPRQQRLALAAIRLLGNGQPFGPETLAARVDLPVDEVARYLDEQLMVQRDNHGHAIAFAGLTLRPTSHTIHVDGRTLYAWCALDTLFLPELLGSPAQIHSTTPDSGETVSLIIDGTTVRDVSPASAVLTLHDVTDFDLEDVIGTFCCFSHFFTSERSASAWAERSTGTYVVSIADGFEYARRYNHQRFDAALHRDTMTQET